MVVRLLALASAVVLAGCAVRVTGSPAAGDEPVSVETTTRTTEKTTSRDRPTRPAPSSGSDEPAGDQPPEADKTAILGVAQAYVDAMNAKDDAAVAGLTCTGGAPSLHQIAKPSAVWSIEPRVENWNGNLKSALVPLLADGVEGAAMVIRTKPDGTYCPFG